MKYFLEDFSKNAQKISCSKVHKGLEGQAVVYCGWVQSQRNHGHFTFLDIKDSEGVLQVFLNLDTFKNFKISLGSVIAVKGLLLKRPSGTENKNLKTGEFELRVEDFKILSHSESFPINPEDPKVKEALKLKYRYLSLRSEKIQKCLEIRDEASALIRSFLRKEGFLEIETPILYKTTPEGARDYLSPSRIHRHKFYSLAQSPQILKQLLMVGGIGKYFQLARCFRDEDLRSDRQPEFTQLDLEMSFVEIGDVLNLNERLVQLLWKHIKGQNISSITRMTYTQALELYGSDKPDLRNPLKLKNIEDDRVEIFNKALKNGGRVKSLALPHYSNWTRSALDKLTKQARSLGAGGLIYILDEGGVLKSSLKFSQNILKSLYEKSEGLNKGLVLILAGSENVINLVFSVFISELGKKLNLLDTSKDEFLWVTDFPLFSCEEGRLSSVHHPFTSPERGEENLQKISSLLDLKNKNSSEYMESVLKIKSKAYDLVCNGQELAGGSVRIHHPELQKMIFQILGLSDESIESQFGFFIEALKYGPPPHGGMAWGLERLVMLLSGTSDIREVMAFPKSLQAVCLMSESPSSVDPLRLKEYGLKTF